VRSGILNIAVFASHGGSDLQAIIDGCKTKRLNATVCAVISNNPDAMALERARREGIDHYSVNSKVIPDPGELDRKTLEILDSHHTEIVFLAGYLKKIGPQVLRRYENRIFNIHPALLPKYGGKGLYGMHVHQAVVDAGEKVSGITIHRVNAEYDSGDIVAQTTVDVLQNDTPESLAARILEREHTFIVEVMNDIVSGRIRLGR
jgi:phosphoribosylglycinamide formyltransferase-1